MRRKLSGVTTRRLSTQTAGREEDDHDQRLHGYDNGVQTVTVWSRTILVPERTHPLKS